MSQEHVSQREFAKQVGRSHVWINRLVRDGRLPSNGKGQIPLAAGLEAFEASQGPGYDLARARAEGERRASAAKKRAAAPKARPKAAAPPKAKATKAKPKAAKRELAPEAAPEAPEVAPGPPVDGTPVGITVAQVNAAYNKARLAEKTFQAKLRELEYKEATGQLIPREEVHADARRTGVEVRERLMAVPPRVANLCEGRAAREIERIIEEAINEALGALQRARFGGEK